jgi:anti-sigma regulatory factor (Ser/Thr protein kinase)
MEVALRGPDEVVDVERHAANEWRLRFAADVTARVELDKCGAWFTLKSTGQARSIVVRRAGWIDVRGHPTGDRVGLGPGDALVMLDDPTGHMLDAEILPEALLDCAGAPADALADTAVQCGQDAAAFVVRVPEEGDRDPILRVVEATGVPADELRLPGYPLGDEQPDLWKRPPDPPREARLRLAPVAASVPRMRELLRRLLRSWRMEDASDGVIELVATELATNAVQHARSDMTVIVRYLGPVVRIEVGDGSRHLPQPRSADDDALDGRGLTLVDALSTEWGVLPTRIGKRVWCDVAVVTD